MSFELKHQSQRVRRAFARVTGLALGIAASSLLAASASAERVNSVPVARTVVGYTDLNLTRQADVETLYVRLQRASELVCRSVEIRNRKLQRPRELCYRTALADAVKAVGQPGLTALHDADPRIRLARGS